MSAKWMDERPTDRASSGGNGVYGIGSSGTFPTNSASSPNFWVDVIFSPTGSPILTPTFTPTATPISGSSFPSTGILDSFNRANGGIGTNWSGDTSGFSIASNQLDVGTGGIIYWNPTSFGADQEAYVTLSAIDTAADEINLYLKIQNNNWQNGVIEVWYHPNEGKVYISTYNNGWFTYGTGMLVTFAAGDRFGARALSTGMVEVYKNSTLVGNRDITLWPLNANGGKIGLKMVNASATLLDDFGGGTQGVCPTGFAAQANGVSPLDNPCVQVTPTPTLTPSPTQEPFEVWHISCNVANGQANARNFPSLSGQVIRTFPAGTTLYVFESRVGSDGTIWKRVTGYEQESFSGYSQTLWVAQSFGSVILEPGTASPCTVLTPIPGTAITPQPTATAVYSTIPPHSDCQSGYSCPLTNSTSDIDTVSFVLACESGLDLRNAIDIAYDIRNRMKSGVFVGTARQVIAAGVANSQAPGGYYYQFQPYGQGCPISTLTTANVPDNIKQLATQLVNNPNNLPSNGTASTISIRWYGLYFIGIAVNPQATATLQPTDAIGLVKQQNPSCVIPQPGVYIGTSPFGVLPPSYSFANVHFSDNPQCG